MITVALIGGDGAGKSTIAHLLQKNFPLPIKYLYMGINIESSNVALPTSKLVEYLKRKKYNSSSEKKNFSLHIKPENDKKNRRKIWASIRFANRLCEEWYRQLLAWIYKRQGNIVLFDRHFLFDFARNPNESDADYKKRPLNDRLHRWFLQKFYPEPDLVIFLYAPPEVLFARKGEATLEYLENLQKTFLNQGKKSSNFRIIDATQPVDKVFNKVKEEIRNYYNNQLKK